MLSIDQNTENSNSFVIIYFILFHCQCYYILLDDVERPLVQRRWRRHRLVIPFFVVVVVVVVAETIKLTQQYDVVERVSMGLDVLLLIISVHGKRGERYWGGVGRCQHDL